MESPVQRCGNRCVPWEALGEGQLPNLSFLDAVNSEDEVIKPKRKVLDALMTEVASGAVWPVRRAVGSAFVSPWVQMLVLPSLGDGPL